MLTEKKIKKARKCNRKSTSVFSSAGLLWLRKPVTGAEAPKSKAVASAPVFRDLRHV